MQYSNHRNFEKYCANEIKKTAECPPPPPMVIVKTKKIFNIPTDIRKTLFPFSEIDSVQLKTEEKLLSFNDEKKLNYLSNIFFNYYTFRYCELPIDIVESCDGIVEPSIEFEIIFYFKNKQVKYIRYYTNQEQKSNFDFEEQKSLDITREKIALLVASSGR